MIELDPQYNVPTDELLESFPITCQTPAETELSRKIQNRMLNGFNRWNMGYEAWEHWGEVLYHDDSIYNVHCVRFTLEEYQKSMDASLKSMDIQMGNFNNMILVDDWMAIRYDITNNILISEDWAAIHFWDVTTDENGGKTANNHMQFLHFVEDGDNVKVDMCWAK